MRAHVVAGVALAFALGCGGFTPEGASHAPYVDADGLRVIATLGADPVPPWLALDADTVYVGAFARRDARVLAIPRAGGPVRDLGVVGFNLRGLAVDGPDVWVATDGGLYRVPKDGTGPRKVGPYEEWKALALAPDAAYVATAGRIVRIDRATGGTSDVATLGGYVWQLRVDGGDLVYSAWSTVQEVGRVPLAGGAPVPLESTSASDVEGSGLWVVGDDYVFLDGISGVANAVPRAGGPPRVACALKGARTLAVDGVTAWTVSAESVSGPIGTPTRPKYSVGGGAGGLYRCDLTTGVASDNLAPHLVRPYRLAADAHGVVVVDSEDGTVHVLDLPRVTTSP